MRPYVLGNAIKFTESGCVRLRVRVGEHESRRRAELTFSPQPNKLLLLFEVEDSGPGIAPEEIDCLFEAFTQTELGGTSAEGTGLGLAISRQFVQLMGGEIAVNSTLGQGATFNFHIPLKLAHVSDIQTQQPIQRVIGLAPAQREYRILVVEDNWANRQLLVKLLTSIGFQVREAENGQEAVALWERWEPQLILMDMQMPVMDGYEATKQIKSHLKGEATVIIALTASAFAEQQTNVLAIGCDDFMSKPFREDVLWSKIANHLGVSYVHEALPTSSQPRETVKVLTPEALAVMPQEWLTQVHRAAEACLDDEILNLIEQIPEQQADLKLALTDLVNNFRLDLIFNLTSKESEGL